MCELFAEGKGLERSSGCLAEQRSRVEGIAAARDRAFGDRAAGHEAALREGGDDPSFADCSPQP
jgi:hypothetical protein